MKSIGRSRVAHVERKSQGDQIFYVLRMQRGVEQREQSAEAVADDRDLFDAAMKLHRAHRVGDIFVNVFVEAAVLVGGDWRNPVDHVNVEALAREILDHAAPLHQIEDERALDQRIDEQDRRMMRRTRGLVVAQADLTALVDDAIGSRGRRIVAGLAEACRERVERAQRAFHPEAGD